MILKNSFFCIEAVESVNSLPKYTIRLNPEHTIFKAHFPDNPIVPGVCQVQIVLELLQEFLGKEVYLREVKNIKFLSVIIPTEIQSIDVTFQKMTEEADELKTSVVFASAEKQYAKISLTCGYTLV